MPIARPYPNITRRPLGPSFTYQMSASQGKCSLQPGGFGKEALKVYCTDFPFGMLSCQLGFSKSSVFIHLVIEM